MKTTFDYLIVGAGIVGLCSAYHLVKSGKKVCVIEQANTTYGATAHSGAGIRHYDVDPELTKHIDSSRIFYDNLTRNKGVTPSESFYVFTDLVDAEILQQASVRGFHVFTSKELSRFRPHVNWGAISFGIHDSHAGYMNSTTACALLQEECKAQGVEFRFGHKLIEFQEVAGRVDVLTGKGEVRVKALILATGYWTPRLLEDQGFSQLAIKNRTVTVHYLEQKKLPKVPFIVEHDSGFHMRATDDGGILFGFPHLNWNIDPEKLDSPSTAQLQEASERLYSYTSIRPDMTNVRTVASADSYVQEKDKWGLRLCNHVHVLAFGNGASFKYAPSITSSYIASIIGESS